MSLSLVIIRGNHLTRSCSEGSVQRPVCMNIDRWAQRCWFCARSRRCAADASVCTRVAIKTSTSEGESPPPLYLRTWQCTVCRSVMQLTPRPTSFVQPVTSATWAIAVSCPLFYTHSLLQYGYKAHYCAAQILSHLCLSAMTLILIQYRPCYVRNTDVKNVKIKIKNVKNVTIIKREARQKMR